MTAAMMQFGSIKIFAVQSWNQGKYFNFREKLILCLISKFNEQFTPGESTSLANFGETFQIKIQKVK